MKNIKTNLVIYISLILIAYFLDSVKCIKDDLIEYDVLEYLKEKEYTLNKTEKNEMIFYLKMEVDKILTSKCLIDIHQKDPQRITLEYKFEKGGEKPDFQILDNWITINDHDKHVLYYEIEKPEEKGNTLYLKISVSKYTDKQVFSVKSTDSQFNFYLLVILIVVISAVLVFVAVFFSFYCMYKSKTDLNDPNNFDIVFAKVGPEDL